MIYESLPGLKPEDYQHPGEKVAMKVLKSIPVVDEVINRYLAFTNKLDDYPYIVGNCYRVTQKTNPRLYNLYKTALRRLDVKEEFPLFVKFEYQYNACAYGGKEPIIVINSSCVDDYTDGELLRSLGHEIGHIKSGHVTYSFLSRNLNSILGSINQIGAGVSTAVEFAIMEWQRNSEYTADRAGLIASGGDVGSVSSGFMKFLGKSDRIQDIDFSLEDVMKQVDDFEADTSGPIGKLLFASSTLNRSHPWTILRIKQINEWYNSGEFEKLVEKFK